MLNDVNADLSTFAMKYALSNTFANLTLKNSCLIPYTAFSYQTI